MEKNMSNSLFLSLGQVIKIIATNNSEIHEKVYFINYIDKKMIEMIEQKTLSKKIFNINEGFLTEESIEKIEILYKPDEIGFARQNNLIVGRSITIEFGGEVPTIINGKISNLEEDRIEIESYPDKQYFYIDFEYKGIPRDLPIKSIRDFILPKSNIPTKIDEDETDTGVMESQIDSNQVVDSEIVKTIELDKKEDVVEQEVIEESDGEEDIDLMPEEKINLEDDIIDINEIEFMDEDLQEISEEVEVKEGEKIFDINDQVSDLMDDLLASVPSSKRTSKFLRQLHTMLERYKELREEFSKFDDMGYLSDIQYKTENYKPISNILKSAKSPVYWALPVVEIKKHLDINTSSDNTIKKTKTVLDDMLDLQQEFKSNSIPDEQNKYDYFYKNLPLDTYDKPDDSLEILRKVDTLNNNVIIDTLDDFYSTNAVIKGVGSDTFSVGEKHRFVIDKLTAGLTKIKPVNYKTPGCPKTIPLETERVNITNNDVLYIKGLVTLPYDYMQYSKIYDVNNSILSRVNYHGNQYHYSSLLNEDTEVLLNDLSNPTDVFNNIVYHYKKTDTYNYEDKELIWNDIIDKAVLNLRDLFKKLKSEIENGVSMDRIVEYFKPYQIYSEDIVFNDYTSIKEFIESEIKSYKKKKIENIIKYNNYIKFIKNYKKISFLDKFIGSDNIKSLYDINEDTDMQFFRKMYQLDDSRLMMSLVAKEIHNELSNESTNLNPDTLIELKKELEEKNKDNKGCEPVNKDISLAKKYYDLDDLLQDNNKNVVYDEKYDTTRYDIYEELVEEQNIKYPELVEHLIKNVGVDKKTAEVDAQSMIDGYKSVQNGDYAILEPNGYELHYYIRDENKWRLDEEMSNKPVEEMGFCNLKESCLKINNECLDKESQDDTVKEMSVDELIKHYEEKQQKTKEEINNRIANEISKRQQVASIIKNEHKKRDLKYDIQKINIGKTLSVEEITVSPYEDIKNRILGEYDMVSKMAHIIDFVNSYCRTPLANESMHWYYCVETNVPLLPSFYYDLAIAFQNKTYLTTLREIEKERGTSDGDNIVDKYSGYVIKKLQYDENEGYEENGFKRVTREVMEEEEDIVMTTSVSGLQVQKKHGMFIKEIKKILKTLDTKLKVNTSQQHEFIVKYMILFMKKYVVSERKYLIKMKELKKKGKTKISSYKKYKDEIKIFLLMGLYVIGIQLVTPHLDYAPTYEGCVMSFDGFPLEEGGDNSIISYIACLFLKLKSSIRPWNVLPSTRRSNFNEIKDKFVEKIIKFMKDKILVNTEILNQLEEKREWLVLNQELSVIKNDFDVKRWDTFLPHLNKVTVNDTRGVSGNFDRLLKESITKGNISQFSYVFSLMGKIINQSFLIQEDMERVISNKELKLNTINNIPFLENACCNETKNNFAYFADKEPLIIQRNNEIKDMVIKLNNYMKIKKAPFIYNDENTKLFYPSVDKTYSENTIYLAFIKYCKYNTGSILDDDLQRLCITNESSFNLYDSIEEKISIMKQEEGNYSSDSLIELMNVIAKRNMIYQGFHTSHISPKTEFENKLNEDSFDILDKEILDSIKTVLDRFDLTYSEDIDNDINDSLLILKNKNIELIDRITNHIKKTKSKKNRLIDFIKSVSEFKERRGGDYITNIDETNIFSIEFLKKCLFQVSVQFPQLILGKINFKALNVENPNWNLSEYHNLKLSKQAEMEYGKFYQFSEDKIIEPLLVNIIKKNKEIFRFSQLIPIYSDVVESKSVKKSVLNTNITKTLYTHLLLKMLTTYIDVEDNIKLDKPFDNPNIEDNIFEESNETAIDKMNELLTVVLETLEHQKGNINLSMEEIQNNVLNVKEMEKTGIVERLKNMSKEDRKSEDYMKNLRLGDWNLGQTKSLYIYDPSQYDREVREQEVEMEKRALIQKNNNNIDSFQEDVALEDMIKDSNEQRLVDQEMMQDMMGMGEDDDFGEMDGDEMY
jgi:hypothetical protein